MSKGRRSRSSFANVQKELSKALVKKFSAGVKFSTIFHNFTVDNNKLRLSVVNRYYKDIYKKAEKWFKDVDNYKAFFKFLQKTDVNFGNMLIQSNKFNNPVENPVEGVYQDLGFQRARNIIRFVRKDSSPFGLFHFESSKKFQELQHVDRNVYHITTIYRVIVEELWENKNPEAQKIRNPFTSSIRNIDQKYIKIIKKHYEVYKNIMQREDYYKHYNLVLDVDGLFRPINQNDTKYDPIQIDDTIQIDDAIQIDDDVLVEKEEIYIDDVESDGKQDSEEEPFETDESKEELETIDLTKQNNFFKNIDDDDKVESKSIVSSLQENKSLYLRAYEGMKSFVMKRIQVLKDVWSSVIKFMKDNWKKFVIYFVQSMLCFLVVKMAAGLVATSASQMLRAYLVRLLYAQVYLVVKSIVSYIYKQFLSVIGASTNTADYVRAQSSSYFKKFFRWCMKWVSSWLPVPLVTAATPLFEYMTAEGVNVIFEKKFGDGETTWTNMFTQSEASMASIFSSRKTLTNRLLNGEINTVTIQLVMTVMYDLLCVGDNNGYICQKFKKVLESLDTATWFIILMSVVGDFFFFLNITYSLSVNKTRTLTEIVKQHKGKSQCATLMSHVLLPPRIGIGFNSET